MIRQFSPRPPPHQIGDQPLALRVHQQIRLHQLVTGRDPLEHLQQLAGRRLRLVVVDHDRRARLGKAQRDLATDADAGAGDQYAGVREQLHGMVSVLGSWFSQLEQAPTVQRWEASPASRTVKRPRSVLPGPGGALALRLAGGTVEATPEFPFRIAWVVPLSVARLLLLRALLLATLAGGQSAPVPRVAIFAGLPGDAARAARLRTTVETLREALTRHCRIPAGDIVVLFGEGKPSPYRECSAGLVARELEALRHKARDRRPVWVFVLGHANTAKDKVFLNLRDRDMEIREFAERLDKLPSYTPQTVVLTTAASGNCLAALARGNRCVLVATRPGAEDNETEFPHLLADILAHAPDHDANADGRLSVVEMATALRQRVKAWYAEQGLMPTETPLLDADADGRPATAGSAEERRAELFALWLHTK